MSVYYVRVGGSDAADGSSATPWLTISKALATVVSGDTVYVGTGTYAESTSGSGYLSIAQTFVDDVTIASESGVATDVVIQGASSASNNTLIGGNASHIVFSYVSFAMRVNTTSHAIRIANSTHLYFDHCRFTVLTNGGQANVAVALQPSGATTIDDITFDTCIVAHSGANNAKGVSVFWTASNVIQNVSFYDCTMDMTQDCLYLQGGSGYIVSGGSYQSDTVHAVCFGADAATGGNPTSGQVLDTTITCTSGHAILFGHGSLNMTMTDCTIYGGDHAIVFKESTGHIATGCTVYCGTASAVYFKAATNCVFTEGTIYGQQATSVGLIELAAGDTGNKTSLSGVTHSEVLITATVTGTEVFSWATATGDDGYGINDYNRYSLGKGTWGSVRGTTIRSLDHLRAVWSTYSVTNNDSHSVQVGILGCRVPFVIISNTGNILQGKKLFVSFGTWQVSHPAKEITVGLDGDVQMGLGSDVGLWYCEFTATVQKRGRRGFASLDGDEPQTVEKWVSTDNPTLALLQITDLEGVTRDALCYSEYRPKEQSGGMYNNDEWLDIDLSFVEREP